MDTTIWLVHPRTDQDHDTDFKILVPGLRVTKPVSPEPIEAKGPAILHLTDLHFAVGEKHRSEHAWNYPDDDPKGATLDEQIGQALKAISRVGVVVISGDFTYLASKAEFEQARKSVLLLLGSLGLGPEHLVIVPGNHDIAWTKGDTYEAGKPVESAPAEAKAQYRTFYRTVDEARSQRRLLDGASIRVSSWGDRRDLRF